MNANFARAIAFTILEETGGDPEGGLTHDPDDPGGTTRWGIAQRFHPGINVETLTRAEAELIYYREYWEPPGCPSLDWPLCLVIFDSAVNPGAGALAQWRAKYGDDWRMLLLMRIRHYATRKPDQRRKKYIDGWIGRCRRLLDLCLEEPPT